MKALCILLTIAAAADVTRAAGVQRPMSGHGPDAKTLLVYTDTRAQYSMSEGLEVLRLQLRRVATQIDSVSVSNATPDKLAEADYLVVFCPQSGPAFPSSFLNALTKFQKPVLWIGYGGKELEELPPFRGQFVFSKLYPEKTVSNVVYRGKTWNTMVYPWTPLRVHSNAPARVLMTAHEQNQPRALAFQVSNLTFVATVPLWGTMSYLFSDLLLDFYDVKNIPESRVFFRLEDYHARSDHREFQRATDYLHARNIPFMVAMAPAFRDPEFGEVDTLDNQPDFVTGLTYAQQRGGRLVMKGCVYDANKLEFWDARLDRPLENDSVAAHRTQIHEHARRMLKHGLFPLAWTTPGSAASRNAYTAIADVFSTGVERLQLSDSTSRETYVTSALTIDRYGRLIIPENAGYALMLATNALDGIREAMDTLTSLRGVVAGGYIHIYQPLPKITALVDLLQTYKLPFLDLADMDNAVRLPDALVLTGDARHTIELRDANVRWKSFDRAGRQLAAEKEAQPYTGTRTFKRLGGDYDLIEFGTTMP